MSGSYLAGLVVADNRRKEYFKQKAIRKKCIIDNIKQCDKCQYKEMCENSEVKDDEDDDITK